MDEVARDPNHQVVHALYGSEACWQKVLRETGVESPPRLLRFVDQNDLRQVETLLSGGADIETRDDIGRTPLHVAAIKGDIAMLELLFKRGADPDASDFFGTTALSDAAAENHEAVVRALLAWKADVHACDHQGVNALMRAASEGHGAIAELLLANGARIDAADHFYQRHALHCAAVFGRAAMVALLAKHGAEVDAPSLKGRTAFHLALTFNHQAVAGLLLDDYKVDIEQLDGRGRSGLHYACTSPALLDWLMDRGARIRRSTGGRTPLHRAAKLGCAPAIDVLIRRGCDVREADNGGATALHLATLHDRPEAVATLLRHGAPVDAIDEAGRTPLMLMPSNERGVQWMLVQAGATYDAALLKSLLAAPNTLRSPRSRRQLDYQLTADRLIRYLVEDADSRSTASLLPLASLSLGQVCRSICADAYDASSLERLISERVPGWPAAHRQALLYSLAALDLETDRVGGHRFEMKAPGDGPVDPETDLMEALNDAGMTEAFDRARRSLKCLCRVPLNWTALNFAIHRNEGPLVKLLLQLGASAIVPSRTGHTPLHTAVDADWPELVPLLLRHGARAMLPDLEGETPRQLAIRLKRSQLTQLLG
ncbi:hypothetical protein VARIO8X_90258 [Burkholderiales bacterium 8X]|nr:hypothetical protein VARIO8X_90258 [Burkholderiales bacterium 8X]